MPDYSKGKIYKIVCDTSGLVYIGSTCESELEDRLASHIGKYKYWITNNTRAYTTSFKIFELNNYHIELLESFPCDIVEQLTSREGYHQKNNICVNKNIAGRTASQYYLDNIENKRQYYQDHKEHKKEYYNKNKEVKLAYQKQYYLKKKLISLVTI
jgi:hypothetical protein